jgi:exonuclease III
VGFHCDFVFTSAALAPRIRQVEIGSFADWIENGLSDHCPVSVEFEHPPTSIEP